MEKIITRNWINKNFTLTGGPGRFRVNHNYDDLCRYIDRWKYILFSEYKVRQGSKIGISLVQTDIRYFSLFFAAAELGMQFVVYQKPVVESNVDNPKLKILSPIDVIVYDHNSNTGFTKQITEKYAIQGIPVEELEDTVYDLQPDFNAVAKLNFATEDSVILLTTSSGSTSTPKIVSHTHRFFYDLCTRNAEVMGFKKDDKILHIRNLHHGSSIGVFFLPTLLVCEKHYYGSFPNDDVNELIGLFTEFNIDKVIVPYNAMLDDLTKLLEAKNMSLPNLTLFNLSYLNSNWIPACKDKRINSIISIFGCNETSGPIFLPQINSTSDVTTFDPKCMGKLLDTFYPTDLKNTLRVTLTEYNRTVDLEDQFRVIDNVFYYHGKENLVRINDIEINFAELEEYVKTVVSDYDVALVLDKEKEKIYLAVFDIGPSIPPWPIAEIANKALMEKYGPLIQISLCGWMSKHETMYGIKIDKEVIRQYFRKSHNL